MAAKIILDCDPGIDDALAIAFAQGHPGIDLLGITTVAGNVGLDRTTRNALAVAEFTGASVPVTAGCATPLVRPALDARSVHGESGLGGAVLPEPTGKIRDGHAVDYIIDTVRAAPGEITLVAVGPLTNIALAVRKEPRLTQWVRDFVIMGGSAGRGNTTPAAEYNIWADPEAAAAVFGAGWTVTMLGLDATMRSGASAVVLDRMTRLGSLGSELLLPALNQYRSTTAAAFASASATTAASTTTTASTGTAASTGAGSGTAASTGAGSGLAGAGGGPPVHDVCAVVHVAEPDVFGFLPAHVEVETSGRLTSGMTVTDFRATSHNAKVAMTIDVDRFWELTLSTYERLADAMGSAGV